MPNRILSWTAMLMAVLLTAASVRGDAPRPPRAVKAEDKPWDAGDQARLTILRSLDDDAAGQGSVAHYVIEKAGEAGGVFREAKVVDAKSTSDNFLIADVSELEQGTPVWFRVVAVNADGERSTPVADAEPVTPSMQFFDGGRFGFFVILSLVCGAVLACIFLARSGYRMWIRKISALDAIDEAVGRATEMGRSCLYIAGLQDLNEIETIAGITVLSRVAEKAAEYDATVLMPTSRSLVMTAARETTQAAYLTAGRPDAYQEERIYYVTDEQFGFVAHVSGLMQREKPAACFYMGQFFAESLILGETGNTIGAIQIAGTAQPAQLPFFVAACDYTLIGEEFFAASAYLSGDPDQLGSLKGQDFGKLLVAALLIIGCGLLTIDSLSGGSHWAKKGADFITKDLLTTS